MDLDGDLNGLGWGLEWTWMGTWMDGHCVVLLVLVLCHRVPLACVCFLHTCKDNSRGLGTKQGIVECSGILYFVYRIPPIDKSRTVFQLERGIATIKCESCICSINSISISVFPEPEPLG